MSKIANVVLSDMESHSDMARVVNALHRLYTKVQDKVAGVCRYCSRAFGVYDQAEALGLPFLAEYDQHPSLRRLVEAGYQIITF
jgi:hypothetical protein